MYPITIFDKGGKKIFRKYTEDTLRTMYDASKLGANYEIAVLVENMVFMALLSYHVLRDESVEYFDFVLQDPMPSLGQGIRKLQELKILSDIIQELESYKEARNAFSHDPFRTKTMVFGQYAVVDECERLFEQGIKLLNNLTPLVQPGRPNMEEYKKRFKATVPGDVFTVKIGPALLELSKRRLNSYEKKQNRKNRKNLNLVLTTMEQENMGRVNPALSSTPSPEAT